MGRRILTANMNENLTRSGIIQVEIPREWTEGVKCSALRVSHLLLDKTRSVSAVPLEATCTRPLSRVLTP